MNSFNRVLRLALRYRFTVVLSIVCALGVAVLWGANIGAVFPFVKVAFQGKSLQDWVADEIAGAETTVEQLQSRTERHEDLLTKSPTEQDVLLRQWIESETAQAQQQKAGPSSTARMYQKWLAQEPEQRRNGVLVRINADSGRIDTEQNALAGYSWVQPYFERYLPHDPFQTLALITLLLLAGTVVKDVFLIGSNIFSSRLAQLATFDLRKLFYRRTLRMDLAAFNVDGTADLTSRFTHDMECVAQGLIVLFGKLVREPLKMAACLIGAACICWRLLLLSLVIAPLAAFLIQWLAKTLKRANRKAMEEMAQIYTALEETFRGIKIIKAFTSERQERTRFHRRSKQYYRKAMKIAGYDSLSRPLTEIMGIMAICLALLAGAYLVLNNETHLLGIKMTSRPLDLSWLLLFYALLAGAADPIRKLSDVFTRLQRATAASDRIYDRLDRQPKIREAENSVAIGRHRRDLVFDGVEFAYHPGQPVVKDVSLRIEHGQTVAIVGPNGCGKSTLANLIPRFYDPTAGEIRLDGVRLTDGRIRDLRRQIGLVTQETVLFDDTVYNNIRYGSPDATHEQIIEAARKAHAHEFIENQLPDGYDSVVGPMGSRLSGGQRQRISLARAILRDPAIIILDEATSQVDLASEQLIQEVLEDFIQDRTAVIITHRLAVLSLADQIVVMQSGQILDVGRHEELLARCGLYRQLYQIQFNDLDESAAA